MANHQNDEQDKKHSVHTQHYILPDKTAILVGSALLFLTAVTVWVSRVDLGAFNFLVAMLVACVKATLVGAIFMNLARDRRENLVIFMTSFLFLAIFILFTVTDIFFRGDVYSRPPIAAAGAAGTSSTLTKPWISTPGLIAKGKDQFTAQCVACHGAVGMGDGPAAAALTPRPRNFTVDAGWKIGRKPSQVFKALKDGIPGSAMASFATLPSDDRWALVHYVNSLGPKVPEDTTEDLAKIGIDPTKEGGGGGVQEKTISVDIAMERLAVPETKLASVQVVHRISTAVASSGAQIYSARCVQCHGEKGEGGIKVKHMGGFPYSNLVTQPLHQAEAMGSASKFNQVIVEGLPGDLMPGNGQLSPRELSELYQYVRSLN